METDTENGEVVGTANDARLKMFESIADKADQRRVQEGEFDSIESDEADPGDEQAQSEVEQTSEEKSEEQARKFKLKVNGKELELTEEELIARAQKIEAADQYLHDAKEAFRKAQASSDPAPVEKSSDEDDLALVRAIQMGTEEEAVQAIRKLKSTPSVQDDVAKLIDQRLTFREAAQKFQSEYADVLADPMLNRLAVQKDAELIAQGDNRPYFERYKEIGDELRSWKQSLSKQEPKTGIQEKLERKQKVTNITAANVRAARIEDEEPDDSPSTVISQIARSRGQRI